MPAFSLRKQYGARPHLWLIAVIGVIVPRRLRADWRQEWEAELRYRERMLSQWDRLDWRNKLSLLRRSLSAFWDALWLQPERWEDEMIQDLRFGVRLLRKSPAFTLIMVISLAIGIGANTAIFSLANVVLLRPLPIPQPERVVTITSGRQAFPVSYMAYKDFRDRNQVLSGLLCWGEAPLSLGLEEQAVQASGMLVSGNYFSVLGVQPAVGRFFAPEEDQTPGTHPVTVISHGMWQRRFGGDPRIIGKTITLNGHPFSIIGVAPQGFTSTQSVFAPEAWAPMMMQPQIIPQSKDMLTTRDGGRLLYMVGRLKPGATIKQAEADFSAIALQLDIGNQARRAENRQEDGRDFGVRLMPAGSFPPNTQIMLIGFLGLFLAVTGLVLLIACANLTSLLLARALARSKEIAVRLALGASRLRIVRQLLAESVLLCLLSGFAGLLVALGINRLLMTFMPTVGPPIALDLSLDLRVLGASLALSFLTGLLFGLAPAWQASQPNVVGALKDDPQSPGYRASRLRNAFVIGQVAMSLLLLVCAGLFLRALSEGQKLYQDLEPERVQTATFDPGFIGYDDARALEFYRRLLESARALPGVEAASVANTNLIGDRRTGPLAVAGRGKANLSDLPSVDQIVVSPGYLDTMKIRLLRGRDFGDADYAGAAPVAIIDDTAARRWFDGVEALGQRLTNGKTEFEIIGVAKGGIQRVPGALGEPFVYLPYAPSSGYEYGLRMILHVRTRTAAPEVYAAIRREAAQLDRRMAPQFAMSLAEYIRLNLLPQRVVAALAGALGLIGLALSAIGVFGVVGYAVTQRTREIGIRMALGARRRDVLGLVLRQGVRLTLIGLAVGLLAAWAVTRLLTALLHGVSATDPFTFAGAAFLLLSVALFACYLPARRATKVDPIEALRRE
ncbi:MAG TPA: ABC transporter permease [Blastocatellia bacterium]|nr:ABC transporter permease [Blastocatellia bacterium]